MTPTRKEAEAWRECAEWLVVVRRVGWWETSFWGAVDEIATTAKMRRKMWNRALRHTKLMTGLFGSTNVRSLCCLFLALECESESLPSRPQSRK